MAVHLRDSQTGLDICLCNTCEHSSVVCDALWPALCQEEANGRGSPHSDDMDAFTLHDIEVCCSSVKIPSAALHLPGACNTGCRLVAMRMPRVAARSTWSSVLQDDEPEVQQRSSAQLPTSTAAAPVVDPKAEAPKAELLKGVPRSDAPSQQQR